MCLAWPFSIPSGLERRYLLEKANQQQEIRRITALESATLLKWSF
ncbi:hypothetical protein [Paenibacillus sp. FSL H7-0357]|nr:hypothetical protein [Paenibacillus sp. FSL H7-0357]